MSFFGKILEKLGFGGTAEKPDYCPDIRHGACQHKRVPDCSRLPSPSPSSMSSHNWNSAQRLTRRNLTGAPPLWTY